MISKNRGCVYFKESETPIGTSCVSKYCQKNVKNGVPPVGIRKLNVEKTRIFEIAKIAKNGKKVMTPFIYE